MCIPNKYEGRYFYHFTHLENLESICNNGLLCTNLKSIRGIDHIDIANNTIQQRRCEMDVTCEPYGKVHDYVPFYWCTVNPMMLSLVNTKNVDQQEVVFLAVSINKLLQKHVIFTNASANTAEPPVFFNDVAYLDDLDWEAIDLRTWRSANENERHRRMAEVLVHQEVPFSDIDYIISWNDSYKEITKEICKKYTSDPPKVVTEPFRSRYFYFTKFSVGRPYDSLVTGPYWLKRSFKKTLKYITKTRSKNDEDHNYPFQNISELAEAIDQDFTIIPELEGIFELETANEVHSENVSDHTLKVVETLINSRCFRRLGEDDQQVLKLAAYLHDIGKGPKSKWRNGKQTTYPDHPADALPMLERILSEEVRNLTKDDIRVICLLVAYHDLIGEIIGKERDIKQLFAIIRNIREFDMLACLNKADIIALDLSSWLITYNFKLRQIRLELLEKLEAHD